MPSDKDAAQKYYEKSRSYQEIRREVHPLAMFSFGVGIMPVFLWWAFVLPGVRILFIMLAIPVFITGIALGVLAIAKSSENREKFKGEGFAICGIALNTTYILLLGAVFAFFISRFF